jgi:hypothetical protein
MAFRDPDAIAERLNKYADAICAFVILECIAFVLGLANKDFYSAVLRQGYSTITTVFTGGLVVAVILVLLCFVGEQRLLGSIRDEDPRVRLSLVGIWFGRTVVIAAANIFEAIAIHTIFYGR